MSKRTTPKSRRTTSPKATAAQKTRGGGRATGPNGRSNEEQNSTGERERRPGGGRDRNHAAHAGRAGKSERPAPQGEKNFGRPPPRTRTAPREDIVAGRHAVRSVLEGQPQRAKQLFITNATESDPVVAAALGAEIPIKRTDKASMDELASGLLHQGYVLEVGPYGYVELEDALAEGCKLALVLDEVEDPRNLGAAARAAYALGADLLVIPERRAARVTASAEKTAAGAFARLRVARPGNLKRALAAMKADGMWIVGGDHRTDLAPWDVDLSDRVVIVIGAEEDGMRRLTREACDHIVAIPMAGEGMSLNAADAATVLLYESARQKSAKVV